MIDFKDVNERAVVLRLLQEESSVALMIEKVDGSMRTIQATLKPDIFKELNMNYEIKDVDYEKPHQSVWDLEFGAWRSFRWDRLHNYAVVVDAKEINLK